MLDNKFFEQFTKNPFFQQAAEQQKAWVEQWQKFAQASFTQAPQKSLQYVQEQTELVQELQKNVAATLKTNPNNWQAVTKLIQDYQLSVFNSHMGIVNKNIEELNQNVVSKK